MSAAVKEAKESELWEFLSKSQKLCWISLLNFVHLWHLYPLFYFLPSNFAQTFPYGLLTVSSQNGRFNSPNLS